MQIRGAVMTTNGTVSPPQALGVKVGSIPQELKAVSRWVGWKWSLRDEKWTKPPVDPKTGGSASTTEPNTWATFERARAYTERHHLPGLGIIPPAGMTVLDLDHCRDPGSGEIAAWALEIVDKLSIYWEVSPSGTGLTGLVWAKKPEGRCRKDGFGMYAGGGGRYVTITGHRIPQSAEHIPELQDYIDRLHAAMFPPSEPTPPVTATGHVELQDAELLERMFSWQNGSAIRRLWEGETSAHGGDDSAADLALLSHLRFATGGEPDRMERMFARSALGQRSKWRERPDYRQRSIEVVLTSGGDVYTPESPHTNGHGAVAAAEVSSPGRRPLTQRGNAERLIDIHGENLRWAPAWGWLHFDGSRWARVDDAVIEHLEGEVVRHIYREAAEETDSERRKALAAWAPRSETQAQIAAMVHLARGYVLALPDDFDRNPMLFNVADVTINLATGKPQPHARADMITKLAPVTFDLEARCPLWEKFLDRIFWGNPDAVSYLQDVSGYTLSGLTREQIALILWGLGLNGKTTLLETLLLLFGDYGAKASFDTFLSSDRDGPRNDLAGLVEARLVVAVESEAGRRLNETLLKEITGGDTVKARFLHKEFFSYKPHFQLWLGTNNLPTVREQTHALWRRLRLVRFGEVIPEEERDPDLPGKLSDELPGILNWALEGCLRYLEHGLHTPLTVLEATSSYQSDEDPLDEFLSTCCTMQPDASTLASNLYAGYKTWAETAGVKPKGSSWFGRLLTQKGIDLARTGRQRFYLGIRLGGDRK